MKIIYGELSANDKSVRINGNVFLNNKRNPSDIRYLPQFKFIPKSLTLERIFDDFELSFKDFIIEFPEFRKYYRLNFSHLSGGEQRIIEIYTILVSKSKFCMLDEPFSHVMPIHAETIAKLIVKEKANKGIIITDHLYREILEISDSLYIISNGQTYLTKEIRDIERLGYAKVSMEQ
jgi:ABC-type lipopolysaccharide export system ATPase subunit